MRAVMGLLLVVSAGTAQSAQAYAPKVLRVGFVPSENLQSILRKTRPVIDALRKELKMEVVPFVATISEDAVRALDHIIAQPDVRVAPAARA